MAVVTCGLRQRGPPELGSERNIRQCPGRPVIAIQNQDGDGEEAKGEEREREQRAERSRKRVSVLEQSHRLWGY